MKFHSLKKRASKGFGLLEVILVFAIVIGAAAVVFTVFQSAKPSADASNEGSNISTIATNLKSTYGVNHSYAGLTAANALLAKAIPTPMINASATNGIQSQWGNVNVTEVTAANATVSGVDSFDINYASVPTDTCAKLVTGVAGFFDDVQVGGTSVFTNKQPDNTKIIPDCAGASGASTVTLDFIGH
jgi:type II secretory pathway pseudopilin PulG